MRCGSILMRSAKPTSGSRLPRRPAALPRRHDLVLTLATGADDLEEVARTHLGCQAGRPSRENVAVFWRESPIA